jgi:hypothetical protein
MRMVARALRKASTIGFCMAVGVLLGFASGARAVTGERGPSPEIGPEQHPTMRLLFTLRIENRVDGAIEALLPDGRAVALGQVRVPCEKVDPSAYTASKWAEEGSVCGTAVNAMHIHTGNNPDTGRGMVFSLVPSTLANLPDNWRSYRNESSSIYTSIPAGEGVFGGEWSPFSGSRVAVERPDGPCPLGPGYTPRIGDVLRITVEEPVPYPLSLVFENRYGGLITIAYAGRPDRVIGQVLQPVVGVGRFEGSPFVGPGRIRASHPGVICVSVSLTGELGGFQIIPANHGMSPEMNYAREKTQWMVVGPVSALDPSWEGTAPLFAHYIRPLVTEGRTLEERLGRFLVDCRFEGGPWQPLPVVDLPRDSLPAEAAWALRGITHIRILFPLRGVPADGS